jgi:hypothetical protein
MKNTKNTRLRGLPPRLSAHELDNTSGSFPTVARTVLDNRNGMASVCFADDRTLRRAQDGTQRTLIYPLVMTAENISSSIDASVRSSLIPSGSISPATNEQPGRFTVSDFFVQPSYSEPSQNLHPWSDYANPESDRSTSNVFYATGSSAAEVGLGFSAPLWSKTKIELDLTPSAVHSVSCFITSSANYPMAYWNNERKLFEGIGTGVGMYSYGNDVTGLKQFLNEQVFGFAPSMDNGGSITGFSAGQYNLYGRVFDDTGFPYHPKFIATSSQCIPMSNKITAPFLLEKVVYEFSGSIKGMIGASSNTAIWTWFLLNKRPAISGSASKTQTVKYLVGSAGSLSTTTTSSICGEHYMDLIDYAQIAVSASGDTSNYLCREAPPMTPWSSIWSGAENSRQFILSSSCKNPVSYDAGLLTTFSGALGNYRALVPTMDRSGRSSGFKDSNGRDWLNANAKSTVAGTGTYSIGGGTATVSINDFYSKTNPYVLMPGDEIVVGFQLPWDRFGTVTQNSFVFANSGINKVILYGSLLKRDLDTGLLVEDDDGLNQNLTSNAIHEGVVTVR